MAIGLGPAGYEAARPARAVRPPRACEIGLQAELGRQLQEILRTDDLDLLNALWEDLKPQLDAPTLFRAVCLVKPHRERLAFASGATDRWNLTGLRV
jgi:hypothetical protein